MRIFCWIRRQLFRSDKTDYDELMSIVVKEAKEFLAELEREEGIEKDFLEVGKILEKQLEVSK